jgi:hypothetical protein
MRYFFRIIFTEGIGRTLFWAVMGKNKTPLHELETGRKRLYKHHSPSIETGRKRLYKHHSPSIATLRRYADALWGASSRSSLYRNRKPF